MDTQRDAAARTCLAVFAAIAAALAILLAIAGGAAPARAQALDLPSADVLERQAWIHQFGKACCPHDNCWPAPAATLTRDGWRVPGLAGVLPDEQARAWPYREVYACHYPGTKTLSCVFRFKLAGT